MGSHGKATALLERKLPARERQASTALVETTQAKAAGTAKRSVSQDVVPQVRAGSTRTWSKVEISPGGAHGQNTGQVRKKSVVCTNNKHDPRLRENGGTQELGTRSQCMRRRFGTACTTSPTTSKSSSARTAFPTRRLCTVQQRLHGFEIQPRRCHWIHAQPGIQPGLRE